jgi:hypothetical protein
MGITSLSYPRLGKDRHITQIQRINNTIQKSNNIQASRHFTKECLDHDFF